MTLTVRIVTPAATIWDGSAESAILPSADGEMGIFPGHIALTTFLDIGVLRLCSNGRWLSICLFGGFAQVEGDEVTIIVSGAERGDKINPQLAQAALDSAAVALDRASSQHEKLKAKKAFKLAQARLKALATLE